MIRRPQGQGPMAGGFGRGGFTRGGFGMAPPAQKTKDVRKTARRLLLRLRPEWPRISAVALLSSTGVALTVVGPKILGNATNLIFAGVLGKALPAGLSKQQAIALLRAQGRGQIADLISGANVIPGQGIDFTQLEHVLALAALVYVLGALLSWLSAYVMAGVAQRTVYRMRQDVEAKLARLPLQYFDRNPHGDLLSRTTNDIDNITTTLQQGLSQLLTFGLTIIGVLALMIWISPLLALVSLVTIPLSIVVTMLVARRSQSQFAAQWARTGDLNAHVEATHTGHTLVQVFGRRQRAIEEFNRQNQLLYEASFKAQFLSGLIMPAIQFLGNLNYVIIAAVGGYRVALGTMSLGDVQAFILYSRQFTMPITQIANQINLLLSGLASSERVFEFLDAPEEDLDRTDPLALPPVAGRVSLERVSFRYEPEKPLIKDLSLQVSPGQTIAIVGPTGAGKTTVVNLLMRFYEIDAGAIRIEDVDTRDLTRDQVRRVFGMVLQDTWLFTGTIADNIGYGRAGASREEIVAAASAAYVDQFVRTLPDGYETVLNEDASNISSGQKQLITIARAFLANPSILILDEATSNVDTRTEVLIQEAMARLRRGRTSFVIAHRLSTIRNADSIVVMDAGRVVEQGSHAELLHRDGFYAGLYQSQFAGDLAAAS